MKNGLNIIPNASLDFISLGALNHRVDSGTIPFSKATTWQVHPSGGEYNVAANLANCFKLRTGMVSAMVEYPIGDLIAERVRAMGVKPFYKYFKHNGVTGPNMATVYSDQGFGLRAPVVFYNRANEAGAMLKPGDFNWDEIFAGGVRWFHSGGIFVRPFRDNRRVDHRRHASCQKSQSDCLVRLKLSRQALESLGRAGKKLNP
jgi:hypothetical protein